MKRLLLLLYLFIPFHSLSEDELSSNYENTVSYHENGQKSVEGVIKDGKRYGVWLEWNKNGLITNDSYYMKNGSLDTKISSQYYDNGQIKFKHNYKGDKENGKWIYWNKHGLITHEAYFKLGYQEKKTAYDYHDNGQMKSQRGYKHDKSWSDWLKDGKDGKFVKDGNWLEWSEQGIKLTEGIYTLGLVPMKNFDQILN